MRQPCLCPGDAKGRCVECVYMRVKSVYPWEGLGDGQEVGEA